MGLQFVLFMFVCMHGKTPLSTKMYECVCVSLCVYVCIKMGLQFVLFMFVCMHGKTPLSPKMYECVCVSLCVYVHVCINMGLQFVLFLFYILVSSFCCSNLLCLHIFIFS